MTASDLIAHLGNSGDENSFAPLLADLGTVASPGLDEDEPGEHYDWVLIRSRGIEVGFVDAAYFNAKPKPLWRAQGLLLQQVTFYNVGREGVSAYDGELPFGLQWSDGRAQARVRLAAHEASRRSYITDRWDIGAHRWVLRYNSEQGQLDSVHVTLRIHPFPAAPGGAPARGLAAQRWFELFGHTAESRPLRAALAPLDLRARVEESDPDEREIDCIEDGGLTLYFVDNPAQLQLAAPPMKSRRPVLGAVKFYRARDLDARQYLGELPFGLSFEDSPSLLETRIGQPAAYRKDGVTTGYARWHLENCSMQVLYSTIENFVFRVMLMAPGYWQAQQELAEAA